MPGTISGGEEGILGLTTTAVTKVTGSGGDIEIVIQQLSKNVLSDTSQVNVRGWMHNNNSGAVKHDGTDITATITGTQNFTGPNFNFNIPAGGAFLFIDHTFTVNHNADGTRSVNFTVQYGKTGTETFGDFWSVSANLTLGQIFAGCWIRVNGKWVRALPFVRINGQWKKAAAYVRTGGVWKLAN